MKAKSRRVNREQFYIESVGSFTYLVVTYLDRLVLRKSGKKGEKSVNTTAGALRK